MYFKYEIHTSNTIFIILDWNQIVRSEYHLLYCSILFCCCFVLVYFLLYFIAVPKNNY